MRAARLQLLLPLRRLARDHPGLQRPDPDPGIGSGVRDREVGREDAQLFGPAASAEGGLLRVRHHEGHRSLDFR